MFWVRGDQGEVQGDLVVAVVVGRSWLVVVDFAVLEIATIAKMEKICFDDVVDVVPGVLRAYLC